MKVFVVPCILALVSVATSDAALYADPLVFSASHLEGLSPNLNFADVLIPGPLDTVQKAAPPPRPGDIWGQAVCKGQKLLMACTHDAEIASRFVTPINSPWDGDLVEALKTWGYNDDSDARDVDAGCDFEAIQLERAFEELEIDPRPESRQGSNKCYRYVHKDGPAVQRGPDGQLPPIEQQTYMVDGKSYRESLLSIIQ